MTHRVNSKLDLNQAGYPDLQGIAAFFRLQEGFADK
jgi:hypothetical protein